MSDESNEKIRLLNDRFRRSGIGGTILITQGIQSLGETKVQEAIRAVALFDDFDLINDPYGEHDFGSLEIECEKIFWKIDYYGLDMKSGSNDPSIPDITKRVLTIMLAEEY